MKIFLPKSKCLVVKICKKKKQYQHKVPSISNSSAIESYCHKQS